MAEFLDYNAQSGTWTETEMHGDKMVIARQQDVEPLLERLKAIRNSGMNDSAKADWHHVCSIPPVVEVELRKKGLNIYNNDQLPAVYKEIRINYPHLMATNLKHG